MYIFFMRKNCSMRIGTDFRLRESSHCAPDCLYVPFSVLIGLQTVGNNNSFVLSYLALWRKSTKTFHRMMYAIQSAFL